MTSTNVLLGFAGVALTALVTYLVAMRRMSGKIETTDAEKLWAEAGSIREDYAKRLQGASDRALALEVRVASLEGLNTELARENLALQGKIIGLERLVDDLRATIQKLEQTIGRLEATIASQAEELQR